MSVESYLPSCLIAEALAVVCAGAFGLAKGSRAAAAASLLCAALLVVFRQAALAAGGVTAVLAVATYYKYNCICAAESNKTLEMARQMKISLMTEEEEAFQTASKKIYRALAISSAILCCCCLLQALLS
ncbi:unnamed protein product [Symbiodinium pilosum]|uniref:Uncharacterized protein n=1 Tax=Symbiodinium pilosum TaxID=2952 RepID=A0A812KYM7_SYMPI|nr:unnamed protein product [Symbiodinium pilosum]